MEATKADSWNCDLCEVSNKNREDFTKHMAERHLSWSKHNIFGEEENAWWVKCIICGQQTETRKEFWNHTAANHLQLGLPGDVIGSVLESVSGRDYVVNGVQESDEIVDGIDDENNSSFGGDLDIEIDDITDNIEVKPMEGDIVPERVNNVESLPRTDVGTRESESVTKSKAISDGSRHVMKELVMSLKRMGKLHLIFTSAPGTIIDWFATSYDISVEGLRFKLKGVLATECVDEVKEKIPCEAVSKVPEPVLEMREEESVTTPAQQCQKRKVLMDLGPERGEG